jgi:hypothetical protein
MERALEDIVMNEKTIKLKDYDLGEISTKHDKVRQDLKTQRTVNDVMRSTMKDQINELMTAERNENQNVLS